MWNNLAPALHMSPKQTSRITTMCISKWPRGHGANYFGSLILFSKIIPFLNALPTEIRTNCLENV